MDDIGKLVQNLETKKRDYELAKRALAEALGLSSVSAPATPRALPRSAPKVAKGPKPSPDSVSQQVLELIKSDPDGVTRATLVTKLKSAGAVHSALKKHKASGKIKPVNGKWKYAGR